MYVLKILAYVNYHIFKNLSRLFFFCRENLERLAANLAFFLKQKVSHICKKKKRLKNGNPIVYRLKYF